MTCMPDMDRKGCACAGAQVNPGVIVTIPSGTERFLAPRTYYMTSSPTTAPAPTAAPAAQALITGVASASLPTVPAGLQIILLPADANIPEVSVSLLLSTLNFAILYLYACKLCHRQQGLHFCSMNA